MVKLEMCNILEVRSLRYNIDTSVGRNALKKLNRCGIVVIKPIRSLVYAVIRGSMQAGRALEAGPTIGVARTVCFRGDYLRTQNNYV